MQAQVHSDKLWLPRLVSLLLWLACLSSAYHWLVRWSAASRPPTATATTDVRPINATEPDTSAVARLLGGGNNTEPALQASLLAGANSPYQLVGVVAASHAQGYALISVNKQPARAFRVGAKVSEQWLLQSVATRSAALAPAMNGPVGLTLELPAITAGNLSSSGNPGLPVAGLDAPGNAPSINDVQNAINAALARNGSPNVLPNQATSAGPLPDADTKR